MEPVRIDSFCQFHFVSNPGFSPDGRYIAFVVRQADLKSNSYPGNLYFYDTEKDSYSQLTTSGKVTSYIWLDEKSLLYPEGKTEEGGSKTIYHQIFMDGGEAFPLFEVPVKADGIQKLTDSCFLITGTELMKNAEKKDPAYEVIDEVPFWSNGKGMTNKIRRGLYLYSQKDGSWKQLSEESADVAEVSVRGNRILYRAYPWMDVRGTYYGIYLYDLETGKNRCLLEKETRRTGFVSFWADDQALVTSNEAYGDQNPYGDNKYQEFYTMDLNNGQFRHLAAYDHSSQGSSVGSDARLGGGRVQKDGDGQCYFISTIESSARLCKIDQTGAIEEILKSTGDMDVTKGSCDSFDVYKDQVVVCGLYGNRLAELYLNGKQITHINDMGKWQYSVPEETEFQVADGSCLKGWIMKPAGYKPGHKYPAILNIHGGPRTVFGSIFHHEMQVWANAGYFVFYTNPRGSDGFGSEYGDICGKYGTVDYEDLMAFTDHVLARETDIDPSRVGVTGGSYGGFMTNWIIGHTDRFAAAASQRSIANWISFEHMSDIGHTFTRREQSVLTVESAEKLWKHSPLKYVGNCKTPTLFVHSDQDYRCNVAEGMEMFAALKVLGVETRMCVIHGENHELSRSGKPRNRIIRMQEILNWMDHYLKGGKEA